MNQTQTWVDKIRLLAILGILCLIPRNSYSQTADSSELNFLQKFYQNIPDEAVPTGYLMDRTGGFINYSIDTIEQSLTHDRILFKQAIMDFGNASVNPYGSKKLDSFIITNSYYNDLDLYPIGVINKQYNLLDLNSIDSNKINIDTNQLVLTINQENIPFTTHNFQTVSLLRPVVEKTSVNFILPKDLIFSDDIIESYSLTIGETIYDGLEVDRIIPIHLQDLPLENGLNNIIVTVRFREGIVKIPIPFTIVLPIESPHLTATSFTSVPCNILESYTKAQANAYVIYNDANIPKITKPLVIVEGFDPDNNPEDLHYGNINYRTFVTGKSYNEDGKEVYQQLKHIPLLLSEAGNAGYDIIIVDFKNSTDFIENNSKALASILQWVQDVNQGKTGITIIGASMGGLICKYTLSELEKANCNICINALFSFDAPNYGANIPVGIQQATSFFANTNAGAKISYDKKLATPAAMQMLFYNHADKTKYYNSKWNQKYQLNKDTESAFFLGISNGSRILTPQDLQMDEKYLNWYKLNIIDIDIYSRGTRNKLTVNCHYPSKMKRRWPFRLPEYYAHGKFYYPEDEYYDGNPGGKANFIEDIYYEFSKIAQNEPLIPNPTRAHKGEHCFIPIFSSLFLDDFQNYKSILPLLGKKATIQHWTPFDDVFIPINNEAHVLINPLQNENLSWCIDKLKGLDPIEESILPNQFGSTFNISKSTESFLKSITLNANGLLEINSGNISNYGTAPNDYKASHSLIEVRTLRCSQGITINDNAEIKIGQNKNYSGFLIISRNTNLNINNEGILRIKDGSKVIIEEGAELIYHPGAKIILEGPDAVLEIRGKLIVKDGATFQTFKGNASQKGYVIFNLADNANGNIYPEGTTAKFDMSGGSKTSDKFMHLAEGTKLVFPKVTSANHFAEIKGSYSFVEFEDNTEIITDNTLNLSQMLFIGSSEGTIGLKLSGQTTISLSEIDFDGLANGITVDNTIYNKPFVLSDVNFFRCGVGLYTIGETVNLNNIKFSHCEFGLLVEKPNALIKIENCEFLYNKVGLPTAEQSDLLINDTWFLRNDDGIIDLYESSFTFNCSVFEDGSNGITTNGFLNISRTKTLPNHTASGGDNTFYRMETGIRMNGGEIYLENGANNFIAGPNALLPYQFIVGSLTASINYIPSMVLNATGNYWDPIPTNNDIVNGLGTHYSISGFTGIGPHPSPTKLSGIGLTTYNQTCFGFPRLYPNQKNEHTYLPPSYQETELTDNMEAAKLLVYPNPAKESFTIDYLSSSSTESKVKLLDLQGKVLLIQTLSSVPGRNSAIIEIPDSISKGMYLLQVTVDGQTHTMRMSLKL